MMFDNQHIEKVILVNTSQVSSHIDPENTYEQNVLVNNTCNLLWFYRITWNLWLDRITWKDERSMSPARPQNSQPQWLETNWNLEANWASEVITSQWEPFHTYSRIQKAQRNNPIDIQMTSKYLFTWTVFDLYVFGGCPNIFSGCVWMSRGCNSLTISWFKD